MPDQETGPLTQTADVPAAASDVVPTITPKPTAEFDQNAAVIDTTFADGTLPSATQPETISDTAGGTPPLRETLPDSIVEAAEAIAADAAPPSPEPTVSAETDAQKSKADHTRLLQEAAFLAAAERTDERANTSIRRFRDFADWEKVSKFLPTLPRKVADNLLRNRREILI